jgi:hypothetical protein
MRPFVSLALVFLLTAHAAALDGAAVRVEHSKRLPRGRGLGTQTYAPTDAEKAATKGWKADELDPGGALEKLTGNIDKRIAWFGIILEIKEDKESDTTRLVVEMKYFDGLTDLHLQIVSINGAGDFAVVIPGTGHKLKSLSLVRVYGKVAAEPEGGIPEVSADFVRSWDWKLFAFMPYGKDHSNPKWVKLRRIENELDVYDSNPTNAYYEKLLGKRSPD